jgi:hypothetical protein
MKVYFVVCLYFPEDKWGDKDFSVTKKDYQKVTCGFFRDYELAERVVKENITDIYENGYYNLAVIEEVQEGMLGIPEKSTWFSVEYVSQDKYNITVIDKPPCFKSWNKFW